jgi:hypothetical protein
MVKIMSKKFKIILSISLFLLLVLTISQFTLGERIKFGELPLQLQAGILRLLGLNPPQAGEYIQRYELLIKKAQTGVGPGAYQAGDIVMAKPGRPYWASGEINNFWIVAMYLTPSQAELLVRAKEITTGTYKETGEPITELLARRQFYIEPKLLEQLDQGGRVEIDIVQER